jgi:putative ABC transport system ATP-binding protein
MIIVKNLVKRFTTGDSELTVLKGLSFAVQSGEFVSIIGRSGSGKSTLLYQMGLLDHPTSGEVWIDGVQMADGDEDARSRARLHDLGYVFQDYALVPELTALENVITPLLMQGIDTQEAEARGSDMLEKVGLGGKQENLPSRLSGGEQQRVSIARAIAHHPKILFADEPTANLDNDTGIAVLEIFASLHKEGQTIVMVTHEPEYAKRTDRVLTLFDGVIVADIPAKELKL